MDVFTGGQPIYSEDRTAAVIANAEIYNHLDIRKSFSEYHYQTKSDCEAILPLILREGAVSLAKLRGMFAFVAVYDGGRRYVIGRDHVGILSLYYGFDENGALHVSSELKALEGVCKEFKIFPPGHYMTEDDTSPVAYYQAPWQLKDFRPTARPEDHAVRSALTEAVQSHLMADVDVGFLLSGGLDSSLVASIGTRLLKDVTTRPPKSYSIGLEGSPDLIAAREVAEFLGLQHNEYIYTLQEGIDAVRQTIYHLESYDITSVRASVPMYLLSRRIRGNGTKVVLTGDGADESFAGYLYFHMAPDAQALHQECAAKLDMMHMYDCLRANKTMLAWGVEPRVPFLDKYLLQFSMGIDPEMKLCGPQKMEKYLLRRAFEGYLPPSVLWRQKEQSSDGVGYGWIDGLKKHAEGLISDTELTQASSTYRHNPPKTKEGLFYRKIFHSLFSSESAAQCAPGGKSSGNASRAATLWLGKNAVDDPSGRALIGIHQSGLVVDKSQKETLGSL